MATLLPLLLKASLALLVFSLGLSATLQDTTYLFRRPGQLARALVAMFVVLPITALILARVFHPHPAVKIAIVALASLAVAAPALAQRGDGGPGGLTMSRPVGRMSSSSSSCQKYRVNVLPAK